LLGFPRRRRFAIAQPHDHVADPDRLAGPEGEVAFEAIALVEQAEHRDPRGHGRRAGRELRYRLRHVDRLVLDFGVALPVAVLGTTRRAGGEREHHRDTRAEQSGAHRNQSGVHAW
jgi:hypothetical protein